MASARTIALQLQRELDQARLDYGTDKALGFILIKTRSKIARRWRPIHILSWAIWFALGASDGAVEQAEAA